MADGTAQFLTSCPLVVLSVALADIHIVGVRLRAMQQSLGIVALATFSDGWGDMFTANVSEPAGLHTDACARMTIG